MKGMLSTAHRLGKLLSCKSLADITSYHIPSLDPALSIEDGYKIWEIYGQSTLDPESVPIVELAKEGVVELEKSQKQLTIVTARSDDEIWKKPRTMSWIGYHFPMIRSVHFVNHFTKDHRPKSEVCISYDITLLIDDSIENARDICDAGISMILLEKPWNRMVEFEHPLLYRAKNWKEIITSLEK
jgi:hypothetical protein